MSPRTILIVLGSLITISGVGVLAFNAPVALNAHSSRDWPTADGVIVASEIAFCPRTGRRGTQLLSHARIEYQYEVAGVTYTGTRRTISGFHDLIPGSYACSTVDAAMRATVNRYPAGLPVRVAYQPDRPANSVLEPGIQAGTLVAVVSGALRSTFGDLLIVVGLLRRRRH